MGLCAGSMEPFGKKICRREVELSEFIEVAFDPFGQALNGISFTIWRFLLPLAKDVILKGARSSIFAGSTHMSLAGPSPPTLNVGVGGREAVADETDAIEIL